ncbi:MAG: Wzy polymerase domain-containing protein, partial [Psychromonas sp.]
IPLFTAIFMITNLFAIHAITHFERSQQRDLREIINIVNPLVFEDNLSFHLYNFRLTNAINTGNQAEIEKVILGLEKTVVSTPKPFFYHLLYIAYQHHQQPEQAADTLAYARYLYPGDSGLRNADKVKESASESTSAAQASSQGVSSAQNSNEAQP